MIKFVIHVFWRSSVLLFYDLRHSSGLNGLKAGKLCLYAVKKVLTEVKSMKEKFCYIWSESYCHTNTSMNVVKMFKLNFSSKIYQHSNTSVNICWKYNFFLTVYNIYRYIIQMMALSLRTVSHKGQSRRHFVHIVSQTSLVKQLYYLTEISNVYNSVG